MTFVGKELQIAQFYVEYKFMLEQNVFETYHDNSVSPGKRAFSSSRRMFEIKCRAQSRDLLIKFIKVDCTGNTPVIHLI